jgi:hypothetical protein
LDFLQSYFFQKSPKVSNLETWIFSESNSNLRYSTRKKVSTKIVAGNIPTIIQFIHMVPEAAPREEEAREEGAPRLARAREGEGEGENATAKKIICGMQEIKLIHPAAEVSEISEP